MATHIEDQPDYEAALEILREYYPVEENKTLYSNLDYLGKSGSIANELLYIEIFVPRFTIIENSVLLEDGGLERLQSFIDAKKSTEMSLQELKSSFNYRELPYMFANYDANCEDYKLLAEFIAEAWRAHLLKNFPQRKFTVYVAAHDATEEDFYIQFEEICGTRMYLNG